MNSISARILTAVTLLACLSSTVAFAAAKPEFVRLMNIGKAHLENRNSAKAIEAFSAAVNLEPKSPAALRNLARAQMLASQDDEALKLLSRARAVEKNSAATSYLTGLAHMHRSEFEQAVPFLEEAARLDAFTVAVRFQLAGACQLAKQNDKALVQLRETARLDPLHASARFKLAVFAAQAGDRVEQEKQQQEFMRLRKLFNEDSRTPVALERCVHTQPEAAPAPPPRPTPGIKVRFTDASGELFADEAARTATAAAVLDVDEKGRCMVFVVDAQGAATLLTVSSSGKLARVPVAQSVTNGGPFRACIAGDFFDDVPPGVKYDATEHARNDIFLLGPDGACLLKRAGTNAFEDVTEHAGLAGVRGNNARWVDYDHDGDLDLTVADQRGLQLWQNNGDGRFTNVTAQVGLVAVAPALDVAAVDLDANVAIDLITARGTGPTLVCMNQRAGQFARMPEPPGPWPPARRVLADDLDNDGHMDAVLIGDKEAAVLFGRRAARHRFDFTAIEVSSGALLDFDNDGWLDFCAVGTRRGSPDLGAVRLWRNTGDGKWTDVTESAGLASVALSAVREVIAADLDADGDTDLLLVTVAGRLHILRNDGGNVNGQFKARLLGTKTNPTGLGTRVELRVGDFRAVRSVSALPVEIGLGNRQRLDSVQTVWGNGVVDNQIDVSVKPEPLLIAEKNVAAGSCPYLYAWDGRGFRFVTDLLGNAPLGLSLRRDVMLPADPEEIVLIGDGKKLQPRRGAYEVEVTEELREVLYLDSARLIAVDHAPGLEIHSTDKLGPPPFPPSELWALRALKPPLSARGGDGLDRTEAVRAIDGTFTAPGRPLPPPLRGQCEPLTLTLDFGPLDAERPLVLALTGWIQYGDASANIAASQNATLPVIPPRLEVEAQSGEWLPVDVVVGMPAGKTKTILCDLAGKVPRGAKRLRLTTTFELRWDRIALGERVAAAEVQSHELAPTGARLRWRGFSEIKSRAPGHPQTPAYANVSERPPWRTTPQGWCTRYGDVLELAKTSDERLVLVNAGDALTLRFAAKSLPPVPPDRVRTFFFHSVGWEKDGDHNVVEGDMVEPLPVSAPGDWQLEYNTRWVAGDQFSAPPR